MGCYQSEFDEYDNEVELLLQGKGITIERLLEIIANCSNMTAMDYQGLKGYEGCISSAGSDGIRIVVGFMADECGEVLDVFDMTPPIPLSKEGEYIDLVIQQAKESLSARQELAEAIARTLEENKPIAPQYQEFIIDCIEGKVPPPKLNKPKRSETDYIDFVRIALEITEEFNLPLTRNDVSPPHSALDVVSFMTRQVPYYKSISYATLKKHALKAYQERPVHYI